MVEIKEIGVLQKYQIKCPHCNSILVFDKLDEKSEYNPDVPFEGQATDWSIKCTNCNRYVPTRSLTDRGYYEWRKEI
jgi:C4-type Zn-finger protein